MNNINSILPPELLQSGSATSAAPAKTDRFDKQEFYPSNLAPDTSESFRLLGCFSSDHSALFWRYPVETLRDGELKYAGYRYSAGYPGAQPEDIARQTDWSNPSRPKLEGEFCRPKSCLVWLAWSDERQRPELLLIEQKSLKESLTEILSEGDDYTFNDGLVATFTIKITRKGAGIETAYSILPKLSAKVDPKVTKAFEAIKDTATVSKLLLNDGSHPMTQPAATFTSKEESEF